jgi:hypothetical protein
MKVCRTQAVAEVLSEDPTAIWTKIGFSLQVGFRLKRTSIGSFLDSVVRSGTFIQKEEWVVGQTEEQRYFFHDLENGVLDWGSMRVWERIEIERDDGDTVRKLFWLRRFRTEGLRLSDERQRYAPTYLRAE